MKLKNTKNVIGALLTAAGIGIGAGMLYEFGRSSGRVEVGNALLKTLENSKVSIDNTSEQESG